MPGDVIDVFGFALHLAQMGKKHDQAKPLRGFGSAGVLEVVELHDDCDGDATQGPSVDIIDRATVRIGSMKSFWAW